METFSPLVVNASIIDMFFGYVLSTVTILLNIDVLALNTPLTMLFSPPEGSFIHLIFSRVNVLAIWYTVAIAAGVSVFSGMKFKKSLIISFLYFLFKAVVGIAFSYIFIQISKQAIAG